MSKLFKSGSKVAEFFETMVMEKEMEVAKSQHEVRFSVTISDIDDFRLRYIANELNMSRAGLAADIIRAAIVDAEAALGLNILDDTSEYGKAFRAFLEGKKKAGDE